MTPPSHATRLMHCMPIHTNTHTPILIQSHHAKQKKASRKRSAKKTWKSKLTRIRNPRTCDEMRFLIPTKLFTYGRRKRRIRSLVPNMICCECELNLRYCGAGLSLVWLPGERRGRRLFRLNGNLVDGSFGTRE